MSNNKIYPDFLTWENQVFYGSKPLWHTFFFYQWEVFYEVNKILWLDNNKILWLDNNKDINNLSQISLFLRENINILLKKWADNYQLEEIFIRKNINVNFFKDEFWLNIINYFIAYIEGNWNIWDCPYLQKLISFFKDKNLSIEDINTMCNLFRFSVKDIINNKFWELVDFDIYRKIDEIMLQNLNWVLTTFTIELSRLRENLEEKNIQLLEAANIDYLTWVYNRKKFIKIFNEEISRIERMHSDNNLSLLFIDIDNFKAINDNYWHNTWDIVLKEASKIMWLKIREIDKLFRYWWEEFTIILPSTDLNWAIVLAEQLRYNISNTKIKLDKYDLDITISIWVSEYKEWDTTDSLLDRADDAMYKAKNEWKNKVCIGKIIEKIDDITLI